MAFYRRRPRPLWRSLVDLAAFLIVLTATLYAMQRMGMVDLGTSPVEVVDGDSLRRQGQEIRLLGIDAPEYRQTCRDAEGADYACGRRAREALKSLIDRRDVHCVSVETDRYERAVSTCSIDKLDVGAEMVRQGWAIALNGSPYKPQERLARKEKRGIWAGSFESPSDYRARMRAVEGSVAEFGEDGAVRED